MDRINVTITKRANKIPVYQADKGKQMPQYPRVLTLTHSKTFHNNTLKTISANLLKQ